MSTAVSAQTLPPVRITRDLTWTPDHPWGRRDTRVAGALADGRRITVATWNARELVELRHRIEHAWLCGGVAVHCQETAVVVMVPVNDLTAAVVAAAVRTYLVGGRVTV